MESNKGFRCPFEIKGEREGAVLFVQLCEDRDDRIRLMQHALKRFHEDLNLLALKVCLPDSYQGIYQSNKKLHPKIVPIQCELLAVELEMRLDPFLPHQLMKFSIEERDELCKERHYHLMTASAFAEAYCSQMERFPENLREMADWIQSVMFDALEKRIPRPVIKIRGPISAQFPDSLDLIEIHLSAATILLDRLPDWGNPRTNLNLYSLVMTPFYPKAFGRYSEDIQIMMSREADFYNVSEEARIRMRHASNTVLRKAGVRIKDLDNDKQEGGLWIPEYRLDKRRSS